MTEDVFHPSTTPEFEYERGQTLTLEHDPAEMYWYVVARLWNYDAEVEDFGPVGWYYQQYEIATVESIGSEKKLVTEKTLEENFKRVSKEEAEEAVFGDGE